jgi:imidazole glycerol-phosphate synthase subunit HisH
MGVLTIIDYGVGNLRSVQKAFEHLGFEARITSDAGEAAESSGLILPGVGAFPDAMDNLKERKMDKVLLKAAALDKPILGICLGMQLLFEIGYEVTECKGLGLIPGKVEKLRGDVKIPHMGWNSLSINKDCSILKGVQEGSYVYFVHSFRAEVENKADLNASTFYGESLPAVVSRGNTFGAQFHPEKSGAIGMEILKNFGELIK